MILFETYSQRDSKRFVCVVLHFLLNEFQNASFMFIFKRKDLFDALLNDLLLFLKLTK